MNLSEFVGELKGDIDCFEADLAELNAPPRTKEEWMITLLLWLEWETEMHNEYWRD